jgi:hypothetical protein
MQRIVVVALRIVLCYWCVSAACVASQLAWAPLMCVTTHEQLLLLLGSDHSRMARRFPLFFPFMYVIVSFIAL